MKFASPEFLYALFAIAIPIIIHLFNFRKFKRIYFSNVEFLKEVQQETQSKSQLKHLLILLSRILAIAFLVFAFAQPFIPTNNQNTSNQNNVVGIYVDNSFSMESTGENGTLLDEAKAKAIAIVNAYQATDKFALTTNQFNVGDQRLLTNKEVIDKIEQIEISPQTKTLSSIYSRTNAALNNRENNNKSFYVLSDFQKTISDFKNITPDSSISRYLTPLKANEINNLYIDSCWFNTPTHLLNQQEKLSVSIKNNGANDLENIPLKLYINEQTVAPTTFSVKANESTIITLNYTNKNKGIQQGKIELKDAPVTTDDAFYFSYTIADNINILSVENNADQSIAAIYTTDSVFNFSSFNVNQLDYSLIKKSNLVVLNNLDEVNTGMATTLKSFVDNGGSLLIFPSQKIDLSNYKELLTLLNVNYFISEDTTETKVKTIHYQHPIFNNVFDEKPKGNLNLPQVYQHYVPSKNTTAFKTAVLSLKNGDDFLTSYKVNKGAVYLSTVSLDNTMSSFSKHALFVPILYNIALMSQASYPLFYVIGENNSLTVPSSESEKPYHILSANFDLIPQVKKSNKGTQVFVNNGVELAGNYTLSNPTNKFGLAYNYNRSESDLSTLTSEEIENLVSAAGLKAQLIDNTSNIKSALIKLNVGKTYWKYCIILALLFLAIEIALIKLFK